MSVGTLFCLWLNLIRGEPWQNTEGRGVSEVRVLILLTPSLWGHLGKVPRWNTTTLFKAVFSLWLSFSRFCQSLLLVSLYLGLVTVAELPTPDYCPQFLVVLFQPAYTFVKGSLVNKPLNDRSDRESANEDGEKGMYSKDIADRKWAGFDER